jgi:hypothetical protein
LAYFGQQDTDLAGKSFAEIVDVSGKDGIGFEGILEAS